MKRKHRSRFLKALDSGLDWPEDAKELHEQWQQNSPLYRFYQEERERLLKRGQLEEFQSARGHAEGVEALNSLARPSRTLEQVLHAWTEALSSWTASLADAIAKKCKVSLDSSTHEVPLSHAILLRGTNSGEPSPQNIRSEPLFESRAEQAGFRMALNESGGICYLELTLSSEIEDLCEGKRIEVRIGQAASTGRFRRLSADRLVAAFPFMRAELVEALNSGKSWVIQESTQ